MAINAINSFITSRNFGQNISTKAKAKLSSVGVEQYIFDKNLVMEWCSWIQHEVSALGGITVRGKARQMTAAMFKTLKTEFKKDASKQGIHMGMDKGAFVVTQLSKKAASFQKSSSAANKAIRAGKRAAVDVVAGSLSKEQKQMLQATMFGHHSGVRAPEEGDPITTGGTLKVYKDLEEHRKSKGMTSDADLDDIIWGIDQRSQEESLYHVIVTRLSNHIETVLGFDRTPLKLMDKGRSKLGAIEVENVIHISFALGTGKGGGTPAIGTKYKQALNAWDAGRSGGLTNELNRILDGITADLIKDIINASSEFAPDLIKLRGSASVLDHVQGKLPAAIVDTLFPHKTRADMRFRVNKKLHAMAAKGKMTSGSVKGKQVKGKKPANFSKAIMAASLPTKSKKRKGQARTQESPIALRNLLNEMLPQMVASKMTAPALQFRTGRFANSARVENVNIGPRGGTHIDYTYMRNPYETFEPGNKQGSTQRDPKKIIGASIRELATGILGRQPTSIRRN